MGSPMAPQEFYRGLTAPVENLIQSGFILQTHIYKSWTPIFTVNRQFQVGKYRNRRVIRQFSLKPAAVMTIHKANGMSIPAVAVSFQ